MIAQNDDVADGCIAALRAAGIRPGEDVFLSGADGTTGGAEMIKRGQLLATSANVPQYMGALLTTRLYDVLHGWQPRAPERLMNWRSVTMTADNVDVYLERYVDNGDVAALRLPPDVEGRASRRLGSAGGGLPDGHRPRMGRHREARGLGLSRGVRPVAGRAARPTRSETNMPPTTRSTSSAPRP